MKIPCENCNGEGAHLTPSMLENMPDHRLPCESCKGTGEKVRWSTTLPPFSEFEVDLLVRSLSVTAGTD